MDIIYYKVMVGLLDMHIRWYIQAQTLIARWRKHHLHFHMLLLAHYQSDINIDIILVGPSYIFIVRSSVYVFIHHYNV